MDDPFGDAFVIEVGDFFAEDEVLEQRRSAQSRLERTLIVGDRHALVGGQRLIRRVNPDTVQRTHRRVVADVGTSAAGLVGAVQFAHRCWLPRSDRRA